MKNKEKYLDELMEVLIANSFLAVSKYTNKPTTCRNMSLNCDDCLFNDNCGCNEPVREWLEAEYQEPIKLSDDEIVILKNIDKEYKWIARSKNGNLYIHKNDTDYMAALDVYNHLFQFAKWEDEPYNIDELLKQNGVER